MTKRMNYDARRRADSVRGGGADDEIRRPPSSRGSALASKRQQAEIARLAAELELEPPTGLVTSNVAKSWLAKARVQATLRRSRSG